MVTECLGVGRDRVTLLVPERGDPILGSKRSSGSNLLHLSSISSELLLASPFVGRRRGISLSLFCLTPFGVGVDFLTTLVVVTP